MPAAPRPASPRTRARRRLLPTVAGAAVASLVGALLLQPQAHAALDLTGPVDGAGHGYPLWYQDGNGLRLDLCLDGPPACLAGLVDPALPATVANMPDEAFYWAAEASMDLPGGGDALLVLAQEAAWLNEVPEAGQNMTFSRIRIRVTGLTPGETYTVTHPFGAETFVAADAVRTINDTVDVGCATAPCDFGLALGGGVGPFLTWDPGQAPAPPVGFVGDPGLPHRVVGSPVGTDFFRIAGPGLGPAGVRTDLFTVQGKLATGAQPTPDLVRASDTGRSRFDDVTRETSPVFAGFVDPDRAGQDVEILVDDVVAGRAAATGTTYAVTTPGLAPGRHLVRTRIAGTTVVSNPLPVLVDPTPPAVGRLAATRNPFDPGRARFTRVSYSVDEPATVRAAIVRAGRVVKRFPARFLTAAGGVLRTWNGTNQANALVPAGRYAFRTTVVDVAGNRTGARLPIRVTR